MRIAGQRRGETYPGPKNSASGALQNRNVAGVTVLAVPFTPSVSPGSILAAILFTPKVSGVLQIAASLALANDVTGDTYALGAEIFTGTGLTVTGGAVTTNGWVMGSTVPPVIGGASVFNQLVGEAAETVVASGQASLNLFGISQPVPVGVPVVILVALTEVGGGHAVTSLDFINLSVIELP